MKHTITLLIILSLCFRLTGQSLSPQVIASVGGFSTYESGSLSWTMGETFVATHSAADFFLTQGFHQPDFMLVSAESITLPEFRIKVYPNPAIDFIRVEWETDTRVEMHAELYDLVGRRVSQQKSDQSVNMIQIDLQSFQRSAYLLKVFTRDGKFSRTYRIVKY